MANRDNTSNRGFASMDDDKQREIASEGRAVCSRRKAELFAGPRSSPRRPGVRVEKIAMAAAPLSRARTTRTIASKAAVATFRRIVRRRRKRAVRAVKPLAVEDANLQYPRERSLVDRSHKRQW